MVNSDSPFCGDCRYLKEISSATFHCKYYPGYGALAVTLAKDTKLPLIERCGGCFHHGRPAPLEVR